MMPPMLDDDADPDECWVCGREIPADEPRRLEANRAG